MTKDEIIQEGLKAQAAKDFKILKKELEGFSLTAEEFEENFINAIQFPSNKITDDQANRALIDAGYGTDSYDPVKLYKELHDYSIGKILK
jgi:hypothetical protein